MGLGLLLIVCFGVAAARWSKPNLDPSTNGPGLVYEPIRRLGTLHFLEERTIPIMLKNRTARRVRVVGSADFCNGQVCVAALGLPVEVLPGADRPVQLKVTGRNDKGQFSLPMTIYTDCPGQNEVSLTLKGSLAAPLNPVVQIPPREAW